MVSKWVCCYGPSDRIRTCGILLPKQARYQLRYTRERNFCDYTILAIFML